MRGQKLRFPVRFHREDEWWLVDVPFFSAVARGHCLEDARWTAAALVRVYLADWRGQGLEVIPPAELPEGEGWEWVAPCAAGEPPCQQS